MKALVSLLGALFPWLTQRKPRHVSSVPDVPEPPYEDGFGDCTGFFGDFRFKNGAD